MFRPCSALPRIALGGVSAWAVIFLLTGCVARTETYDINIHNGTTQPLTITLAKEAGAGRMPGPYESAWASPEDVAIGSSTDREWWDRQLVPAGKDAWVHHLSGRFNADTRGVLRCYLGDLKIEEVLSRAKGSPDRVDVPLTPGRNDITVVTRDGHLAADVEQNVPNYKQNGLGLGPALY